MRTIAALIGVGALAGIASTIFLLCLNAVTQTRLYYPNLVWGLPFAGLIIGYCYDRWGRAFAAGNDLVLKEIYNPTTRLPWAMAPFILFGTLLTHLFGGSAGREGTAVQMGAALADQIERLLPGTKATRQLLLIAGAGAGFGSAIGAPIAGALFGLEFLSKKKFITYPRWLPATGLASASAYGIGLLLQSPHTHYVGPTPSSIHWSTTLAWCLVAGLLLGIFARLFCWLAHQSAQLFSKIIPNPRLKPAICGLIFAVAISISAGHRFTGLGLSDIHLALSGTPLNALIPTIKMIATTFTLAAGFKGGEFIPLVYMGSTLGNSLAAFLPLSASFLAGLGFCAVFGAAANVPLTMAIVAAEIFGLWFFPYAAIACIGAWLISGRSSIYHHQQ
jgi:H+/Cl- antiporter ClcA